MVNDYTRLDTGLTGIEKLIDRNQWDDAASNLVLIITSTTLNVDRKFCKYAVDKWETILARIIDSGNVGSIAHRLPLKPEFNKGIYDKALDFYLDKADLKDFDILIKKWPSRYFSVKHFEDELEEKIENHDTYEISYREAIIFFYLSENRYSKAIPHMLATKDLRVFDLLLSHGLISQFRNQIVQIVLLPYNDELELLPDLPIGKLREVFHKPINLLVQNRHNLKPNDILALFSEHGYLLPILFLYLEQISLADPIACAPFENNLIELYARFNKVALLQFLKTKSNYDVEEAIEFCSKEEGLSNELIYLWGKIGENKKALSLIIDDLNDPHLAIEFVKNWGDSDLWEFMIGYSMDKPKFVKALLDSPDEFGKAYLEVIRAMPDNMEVDGLQQTLSRISKDNVLNLLVRMNILKIVDDETGDICDGFLKIRTMGKVFNIDDK